MMPRDSNISSDRFTQLASWSLPPAVYALASARPPHPLFENRCEPLQAERRSQATGMRLDQLLAPTFAGSGSSIALWEYDFKDGHCFDIVYAVKGSERLEYWHVRYADDAPAPESERIACSEQGLFFCLFFDLISIAYFRAKTDGDALDNLLAAAASVGFRHFDEVMTLEEEIGSDEDREALLRRKSVQIAD
jgi:hypothetical protein